MPEPETCRADGPHGLTCTRHGTDHDTHTAYERVNGQLYHVQWHATNANGDPVDADPAASVSPEV